VNKKVLIKNIHMYKNMYNLPEPESPEVVNNEYFSTSSFILNFCKTRAKIDLASVTLFIGIVLVAPSSPITLMTR
jgi:hypothetical protein